METIEEQIMKKVGKFMDEWLAYAKNPNSVQCPIPFMHDNDKAYYCKRILLYNDIATRIDDHNYNDLTELHIMQNKYATIESDFEQLFRKIHGLPRPDVISTTKIVTK